MTTWILLRGLTREKRHWGGFPGLLMKEWPESRVIALELPGNGELNGLASPASIAGMASYCRLEVARLGVPPPYSLLAISMGAMVATAWAGRHPEEIGACVLINASFGAFSPPHHRLRPRSWPMLLRIVLTRTAEGRERLIFALTSQLAHPQPPVVEEWTAIRQSCPVSPRNALRQMLAAARFHAPPSAPVATLVLASAGDRLVDARCSTEIAHRWNCAVAIHPSAGHDLPLDDGAWIVKKIRRWLAEGSKYD
ncbi:MAG: alpha/beta hydrolase [Geothrix sp.]|nr:alpha/beta hydrolase [Geothrix sp.]